MAEACLQRALRKRSVRFRVNDRRLVGKPDIVLADKRIVVFCDGDFWHGRRWKTLRLALSRRANSSYWIAKIGTNRKRDQQVNRALRKAGWKVIRFWETDILADPHGIAAKIAERRLNLILEESTSVKRLPKSHRCE